MLDLALLTIVIISATLLVEQKPSTLSYCKGTKLRLQSHFQTATSALPETQ